MPSNSLRLLRGAICLAAQALVLCGVVFSQSNSQIANPQIAPTAMPEFRKSSIQAESPERPPATTFRRSDNAQLIVSGNYRLPAANGASEQSNAPTANAVSSAQQNNQPRVEFVGSNNSQPQYPDVSRASYQVPTSSTNVQPSAAVPSNSGASFGNQSAASGLPAPRPIAQANATAGEIPAANAEQRNLTNAGFEPNSNQNKAIALAPKGASKRDGSNTSKPTSSIGALLSMGTSLAIVLLLFFGVVALYRKTQPSAGISKLPLDVVEVLGRSSAGPRQSLVVLKFGSKLVLVSQQPGQTETLSEITDPAEVERITKICSAKGMAGGRGGRKDSESGLDESGGSFATVFKQVVGLGRTS